MYNQKDETKCSVHGTDQRKIEIAIDDVRSRQGFGPSDCNGLS